MYHRESVLNKWVCDTLGEVNFTLTPLAGDASFRRYYRLQYANHSYVVMDAPPNKEDLSSFIDAASLLSGAGVAVPLLLACDTKEGFLLLSDFGDQLLLNVLKPHNVDFYYHKAIEVLIKIQGCTIDQTPLAPFDSEFMLCEMNYCTEWFFSLYLHLNLTPQECDLIQSTFSWIATRVSQLPLTVIHRDYHSRNLMILNDSRFILGVIDFQDAMLGPVTYDLVSLLKDCYISWPRDKVLEWLHFFYEKRPSLKDMLSFTELTRAFDLCGLQRHIKVLGVFARLFLRDGKKGYLKDLPLTLKYILECCELYKELHPFYDFLQDRVRLL